MNFTVDAFAAKAEAAAYFHGSQMDENPVGVEYDLDDWLARLRGGTAETELLAIDTGGAVSPIRGALMAERA